jgi:hypothetical protein
MKNLNLFFLIGLFLCFFQSSIACDVCGNYMGATPYNNKNSISFMHRYRVFNGYHYYQSKSQFFPTNAYKVMHGGASTLDTSHTVTNTHSSEDFESYKIFELRAKYFIVKRVEVNAILPVLNNKSKENDVYTTHTGFGDITLNGGYHLILPKEESKTKQKLIVGAGIKLPTGNCNTIGQNNQRIAFEMQSGTGSTDGLVYLTYVIMHSNLGMSLNTGYKINGKNKFQEKINNSATNFLSLFYKIKINKVAIYPSVQANYEYTKGISTKNVLDKSTEVNCLMVGPGLDFYYKAFSLNASWQFTALEKNYPNQLESAGRISVGLNYSFGK